MGGLVPKKYCTGSIIWQWLPERRGTICKISCKTVVTKGSSTHLFHNLKFYLLQKRTPQSPHFHISSTPHKTKENITKANNKKTSKMERDHGKIHRQRHDRGSVVENQIPPKHKLLQKEPYWRWSGGVAVWPGHSRVYCFTVSWSTKSLTIRVAKKKPLEFSSKRQQCPLPHSSLAGLMKKELSAYLQPVSADTESDLPAIVEEPWEKMPPNLQKIVSACVRHYFPSEWVFSQKSLTG